ncbi:MAG: hypothetical protein GC190_22170 [Alphaproteobacteria bacterium]|nr:hypothetical protein [Alphaproteobacteria bacterium]
MQDSIVVQDREELLYLLCEAAEFEHTVMCSYLYAQWTLKRDTSEGVTQAELEAIERWRRSLRQIALEEMLHLSLVNNILAAVGASPHLWRPAFPVRPGHFPADVVMKLSPFNEATVDHFLYIERPEGIDIADGAGFDHKDHYHRAVREDLLSPTAQDYVSQGHLYHGAINGLTRLVEECGESRVFVGHGESQVCTSEFGLPGLFKVTDLASAKRAIEEIVLQGEGAPAHRDNSHYARFAAIKKEMLALKRARPGFEPARPVAANPTLLEVRGAEDVVRVVDPVAAKVVDLGNAIYGLTMRAFAQIFSPAPLPRELRVELSVAATELMYLMRIVGEAATMLPLDPAKPGVNAGLSFALPHSAGQLVQHCAAQILSERADELGSAAEKLSMSAALPGVAAKLRELSKRFANLHQCFEENLIVSVERVAKTERATPRVAPMPAGTKDDDPNVERGKDVTIRFNSERCIHSRHCVLDAPQVFLANTPGRWLHPEAASVEQIVRVAHNCPSGAITYERRDGGPQESAPPVNVLRVRENGPYAFNADMEIEGQGACYRATLCRCGQSKRKPFCDNSHRGANFAASGEPVTTDSDPLPERGGRLKINPTTNGPLQINGSIEICSGTGRTVFRTESARLCRCGASATKPFCDGSHLTIGFRSDR